MNKTSLLFLGYLILINHFTFAQDIQRIKGQVTTLNDTIAVAYAHIGILGTGIGTVSNSNGDFELKGEFNIRKDTLVISHIEYEKKLIPFAELSADTNHIELKRNEYLLADVIVLPEEKKKEIFKNVIKNLKKNYPQELYQCEAFYREVQFEERTKNHTRLIEAAINIQDGRVTAPLSKIKCSILQFRKSDKFTDEHFGSKLFKKVLNFHPNYLHHLLARNPVRYYKDRLHTSKFNPLHDASENIEAKLRLSHIIKEDNNVVYVFHYLSSPTFTFHFYINKEDYAILQFDEEMTSKKGFIDKRSYQFKKIGEKYYPVFFHSASVTDYLKNSKGLGLTENSLTFVNYSPDRKEFKRLRSKHVLPNEIDLYDQKMEYDEDFWTNYNILLDEPLNDKVVSDLERKKSLQKQFEENATTKKP